LEWIPFLLENLLLAERLFTTSIRIDARMLREYTREAFGQYCQNESPHAVRNSMDPRSVGAIAFHLTGNLQGSVKFYVLSSKFARHGKFYPSIFCNNFLKKILTKIDG
jgi:hypothetical protein